MPYFRLQGLCLIFVCRDHALFLFTGILPQRESHEVLRQERLLELKERQEVYQWQRPEGMPGHIKAAATKKLPISEQVG